MLVKRAATFAIIAALLAAASASAQVRTEVRDPLRGVSFHSIALSNEPVSTLDVLQGAFAGSDRLAVGLSVLEFDATHRADEYILWLRHEGRRWLDFGAELPVRVEADGRVLGLSPLRASQPSVGQGTLYEKIELRVAAADLRTMVESDSVKVRLSSDNGIVEKTLTPAELAALRSFVAEVARSLS